MLSERPANPEIQSFNVADLDLSALDSRLELSALVPEWIACSGNCAENFGCVCNSDFGCPCNTMGPCVSDGLIG
jgi:hypothetical protein